MAVGKEYLSVIEGYEKQQVQVYPDACDIGIWEDSVDVPKLKWALAKLANLEGMKIDRGHNSVCVTTRLGFEYDEGMIQGIEVKVWKHTDLRRKQSFYSFETRNTSWMPNG